MRISDWSSDVCSSDLANSAGRGSGTPCARRSLCFCVASTSTFSIVTRSYGGRPPLVPFEWASAAASVGRNASKIHDACQNHQRIGAEERRVGKEWVRTGRARWAGCDKKKNNKKE